MALYRCFLLGVTGSQPKFCMIHADTEVEAKRIAMQLLRNTPSLRTVEVWRDGDIAFRVKQHDAELESAIGRTRKLSQRVDP
jgi:hypothetical protein